MLIHSALLDADNHILFVSVGTFEILNYMYNYIIASINTLMFNKV